MRSILHSDGDVTFTGDGLHIWPILGTHGQLAWGFFSMPHLLWHRTSFDNGHLRGHVTLTPGPSVWQWSCHYLFYDLVCRGWDTNTQPSACEANALTDCITAAVAVFVHVTSIVSSNVFTMHCQFWAPAFGKPSEQDVQNANLRKFRIFRLFKGNWVDLLMIIWKKMYFDKYFYLIILSNCAKIWFKFAYCNF